VISSFSWSFFAISGVLHNSAGQRLDLEKQDGRVAEFQGPFIRAKPDPNFPNYPNFPNFAREEV
jgi:hypothetical protein